MGIMGVHNGYVENGDLFHKGDLAWEDLEASSSLSWDEWLKWTTYTTTTNENATKAKSGAKGTPLIYQTSTIDLGATKTVYPQIDVGCQGTAKVVIEHGNASDLSDATVLGSYTSTNATAGTGFYDETYYFLDFVTAGYEQPDKNTTAYTGFSARYVRITVFVERFASATERGDPVLNHLTVNLIDSDFEQEFITVANTNTLSGSAAARVIPLTKTIEPITQIFYGHVLDQTGLGAFGKYVTKTISKANKTFATFDLDKFEDSTGTDIENLDIQVIGMPAVEEQESGSIERRT
jgi:hypothetical protein